MTVMTNKKNNIMANIVAYHIIKILYHHSIIMSITFNIRFI